MCLQSLPASIGALISSTNDEEYSRKKFSDSMFST